MNIKYKKAFAAIGVSILLLGVLAGCAKSEEEANTVRIALQPYPLYTPIYVAKNLGYLEEELKKIGFEVEYSSFKSGPLVNESFAAGQQDIGVLGDVPAILAKTSGQDTEIIANAAYGEKALAVLVKPDSTLKSASELKGKKVAYVKGSYAHHLISIVLENAGLTFDDIESVNLEAGDIPAAIENNQVDAGVLWEPFITQLVNQDRAKVLIDGTGIKRGNLVSISTKEFAENNPDVMKAYLIAYKKAAEYIESNPTEAAKAVEGDLGLSADELVQVFKNFNYNPEISEDDLKELKVVEQFLRDQGLSQSKVNIDEFVNTTYSDK